MIKQDNLTYIGAFGKTHGYKGEINLQFSQFTDNRYLKAGLPLIVEIEGCYIPFFVKDFRTRGSEGRWLVTIDWVGDNQFNIIQVSQLEKLDVYGILEDVKELYPDFLEETDFVIDGFELTDRKYGLVGKIIHFDDSTENLLIEVELTDGREVTLPFNFDFIVSENSEDMEIETEYPDGILDTLLDPGFDNDIPEE